MHKAFDTVQEPMAWSRMQLSVENTTYTAIAKSNVDILGGRQKFKFNINSCSITHGCLVNILGILFDCTESRKNWISQIKTHWIRVFGIIKIIAINSWEA